MQFNTGKRKMGKITGDSEGLSFILDGYKNTLPPDQQIREVNKNAEEAIQRVQNGNPESYRGIITFEMDKEYYSKHGVAKLCIIDNGDGMTYNFLDEYLIKLGASTRKNKHPNWGAGFKLSALPFNPYGVIIRSWTKENSHGHVVWIHRNPTTGIYETKDDKVWTIRTPKPKGIDKSGTQITFLGQSKDEDTTVIPPALLKGGLLMGGRKSPRAWIAAYLNTKKYNIEKNITTFVRLVADRPSKVIGHKNVLEKYCTHQGSVNLSKATMEWYLLPPKKDSDRADAGRRENVLAVGQFCLVHQDETLRADYAGKSDRNPLTAWGHHYSKYRVALVLKADHTYFSPNLERTNIFRDGTKGTEYEINWKTEWQARMPTVLVNLEADLAAKALKESSDYDGELKKYASLFRPEKYKARKNGKIPIDKDEILKIGGRIHNDEVDPDPEPGPDPEPDTDYGEIEQELGIQVEKSETKGVVTRNNPYPKVAEVEEGATQYVATFDMGNFTVDLNTECLLLEQLINYRVKKDKKTKYDLVKKLLIQIIKYQLQQQVAHIRWITGWEDVDIRNALSRGSLTSCVSNKSFLLEKLDMALKKNKGLNPAPLSMNGKGEHVHPE